MRHGEVSRGMSRLPDQLDHERVHATRDGTDFAELFDPADARWRRDNLYLRYAVKHPARGRFREAHAASKATLLEKWRAPGPTLDPSVMNGRLRAPRHAVQSRADLISSDLDRLTKIARSVGNLRSCSRQGPPARRRRQGSHPAHLQRQERLGTWGARVIFENYEMALAAESGRRGSLAQQPDEAAGSVPETSGMKCGAQRRARSACSMAGGWRSTWKA